MDGANQLHLSIDTLQEIVDTARRIHKENPLGTSNIIQITKTGWRQSPEAEDKVGTKLLTAVSIPQNTESNGI